MTVFQPDYLYLPAVLTTDCFIFLSQTQIWVLLSSCRNHRYGDLLLTRNKVKLTYTDSVKSMADIRYSSVQRDQCDWEDIVMICVSVFMYSVSGSMVS